MTAFLLNRKLKKMKQHVKILLPLLLLWATEAVAYNINKVENDLPGDSVMLKEVVIDGERKRINYRLDRQKISASEVLTAQGGTALDILKGVPGVLVDAEGKLSFRGSTNFLVFVDGKPSALSGTEALTMVSAAGVATVEILTTPSAKYKTEGDAGIINIVSRKSQTDGIDIHLNTSASTYGTLSMDGKLSYRTGKHNFYAGGQASNIKSKSDFQQNKTTDIDGRHTESKADGTRFRDAQTYVYQGGYDFLSDRHRLSLNLTGGRTINPRGGDMAYNEKRYEGGQLLSDNQYDSRDRYKLTKHLGQASADYLWKTNSRGDELALSTRFRYDKFSEEYTESNMFDRQGNRYEGTRGYETEHHWDCDGAVSYTMKYRKQGQLEMGYQYTTYSEHGDYKICYWDRPAQEFQWQNDLYAPFYYRRQVHSGYVQLNERIGKVAFDGGLRAERLVDDMSLPTITSRHNRYTDLFPSAHVAYYSDAGTFSLGYSRRTNRPGIWKLEPYITYEDYYTRIIGNPDLKAEYINSVELGWRNSLKNGMSLSLTGYLRQRTDVVDYIRRAYQPGVTLDSIVNAGDQLEAGIDVQITAKPLSWWHTTVNLGGFYYDFTPTESASSGYVGCGESNGLTGQAAWINTFNVSKNTAVQWDAHVVGPRTLTQGKEYAYFYFDIAARQSLLNGKLSLGLVAHDIFHTARYHSLRKTAMIESETWVRPAYPNIMLSATYYFRQPAKKSKSGTITSSPEFVGKDF